jgi:hypothetical protein
LVERIGRRCSRLGLGERIAPAAHHAVRVERHSARLAAALILRNLLAKACSITTE